MTSSFGTSRSYAFLSLLCAHVVACGGGGAAADPHDSGPLGDGDLTSCVLYGQAGTAVRANCPSDLPPDDDCPTAAPVYDDVTPIFAARCIVCHQAGGLDPSRQFDTYAEIHDNTRTRSDILTQIYDCRMPPPCAPNLLPDERKTLLKWFVCGAPEGRDAATD